MIVTGASAGIGQATGELLAREGREGSRPRVDPIERIEAVRVDRTEQAGPRQPVERTLALHGASTPW